MRLKLMAVVGVLFLLVSCYFFVPFARAYVEDVDSTLMGMSVSLHPGTVVTPPFWTLVDHWDCQAEIGFNSKINNVVRSRSGVRMFQYSVGPIQCVDGAFCPALDSLLDISWQLQDGGKTVAEGNSHEWDGHGEMDSGRIIHPIGLFKAKKWHRYRLVLHINRDASVLNEAYPGIIVGLRYTDAEKNYVGVFVCGPVALVSGLIGLALIYPGAKRWRSQHQSRQR